MPADYNNAQSSNNVKFCFAPGNLVLWANADTLIKASPYFKTLFESGFAEAKASTGDTAMAKPDWRETVRDFEDSDDETDEYCISELADAPPNVQLEDRLSHSIKSKSTPQLIRRRSLYDLSSGAGLFTDWIYRLCSSPFQIPSQTRCLPSRQNYFLISQSLSSIPHLPLIDLPTRSFPRTQHAGRSRAPKYHIPT